MSEQPNDGGPAFPCEGHTVDASGAVAGSYLASAGMTLRDWFAGQALAAIVRERDALRSLNGEPEYPLEANLAMACYGIADAMLAARTEIKK